MYIKSVSYLALCLFSIMLSSCATTSNTSSDSTSNDSIIREYLNSRTQRGQADEKAGDNAASNGDVQQAIYFYNRALGDAVVSTDDYIGMLCKQPAGPHTCVITKIVAGHKEDKAGLKVGDRITTIDPGLSDEYMTVEQGLLARVLDNPLRPMVLLVDRKGTPTFKVTIDRNIVLYGSPSLQDQRIAKSVFAKLVDIYSKMTRLPPIPQKARDLAKEAQSESGKATTAEAFAKISDEYRLATYIAPWWADLHFNYAMFQTTYDDPIGAIQSFSNYLLLRPNAKDAAAVRAKIASLEGPAKHERQLVAWEGQWYLMLNGTKQTYGMWIHRKGNELFVRYQGKVPYLKATIINPNVAKAENRFADDAGSIPSAMENAVNQCFGGVVEIPGTLTLSPDDQQLTLSMSHDFDFNITTCRFVSSTPSSLVYVR